MGGQPRNKPGGSGKPCRVIRVTDYKQNSREEKTLSDCWGGGKFIFSKKKTKSICLLNSTEKKKRVTQSDLGVESKLNYVVRKKAET